MTGTAAASESLSASGKWNACVGRDDDGVGVAAEARERDHAIPFGEADDRAADRVDVAGDLVADDERRLRRVRIEAQPRQDVGEVDPGGAHADPDLAVAGRRVWKLACLEHVGRAVSGDDDLAHTDGVRS